MIMKLYMFSPGTPVADIVVPLASSSRVGTQYSCDGYNLFVFYCLLLFEYIVP